MEAWIGKTYQLFRMDNFELFMKKCDMSPEVINIAKTMRPSFSLRRIDDRYQISINFCTKNIHRNEKILFKPGENIFGIHTDGSMVIRVYTFDGPNKLRHVQTFSDGTELTVLWEFSPEVLKCVSSFRGVECIRIFRVVEQCI